MGTIVVEPGQSREKKASAFSEQKGEEEGVGRKEVFLVIGSPFSMGFFVFNSYGSDRAIIVLVLVFFCVICFSFAVVIDAVLNGCFYCLFNKELVNFSWFSVDTCWFL